MKERQEKSEHLIRPNLEFKGDLWIDPKYLDTANYHYTWQPFDRKVPYKLHRFLDAGYTPVKLDELQGYNRNTADIYGLTTPDLPEAAKNLVTFSSKAGEIMYLLKCPNEVFDAIQAKQAKDADAQSLVMKQNLLKAGSDPNSTSVDLPDYGSKTFTV